MAKKVQVRSGAIKLLFRRSVSAIVDRGDSPDEGFASFGWPCDWMSGTARIGLAGDLGMKFALAILLAVRALTPPDAWADDLSMENNTGRIICELRLSGADGISWRENLLGSCLGPGAILIAPVSEADRPNLLAVFDNGDYLVYYGLEFGQYRHLKLWADEAELFEWNPAAEKPKPVKRLIND